MELDLLNNSLNSQTPKVVANVTQLGYIDLSLNNLISPFPYWVEHLKQLKLLELRSNMLTGPRLLEIPSLTALDIADNQFTGQIYEFNSSESQLQYFLCRNDLLHGSIPRSDHSLML